MDHWFVEFTTKIYKFHVKFLPFYGYELMIWKTLLAHVDVACKVCCFIICSCIDVYWLVCVI